MSKQEKSFKSFVLPVIVLVAICIVIGAAMAAINFITAPKIASDHEKKEREALSAVLPENQGFTRQEIEGLPESVVALYTDNGSASIAVMLSVRGYDSSNPMSVAVGFDEKGNITKCSVISCTGETRGIGSKVASDDFLTGFIGKNNSDSVDTISGATISSRAFKSAIDDACRAVAEFRAEEVTK